MKQQTISATVDQIWSAPWQYNDAGRNKSQWQGTNDCGVRAFALAHNMPYVNARKYLKAFTVIGMAKNRRISNGIFQPDFNIAMESMAWFYTKAPKYTYVYELPDFGMLIIDMPKHFSTLIDGIIHDTWNSTNNRVNGYWSAL